MYEYNHRIEICFCQGVNNIHCFKNSQVDLIYKKIHSCFDLTVCTFHCKIRHLLKRNGVNT